MRNTIVSLITIAAVATCANAAIITGISDVDTSNTPPALGTLQESTEKLAGNDFGNPDPAHTDRGYGVVNVGTAFEDLGLEGLDLLQTANDDKNLDSGDELYTVTFGQAAKVFLFSTGSDVSVAAPWATWTDTNYDVQVNAKATDVFTATAEAGTYSLYAAGGGPNYFLAATEVPEPATMSLLGLGGLVALRRRRR